LCLDEEVVKHILLDWLDTVNWRINFLNENWLHVNKDIAFRTIFINKDQISNLGKCKWFNKISVCKNVPFAKEKWFKYSYE
jgi:hypothetical protein